MLCTNKWPGDNVEWLVTLEKH
uniref:Uncharacterized protein n=1 Tax=Anguilla anguilla TaxID=7936 RepID=A0A0E9P659_ANGAN